MVLFREETRGTTETMPTADNRDVEASLHETAPWNQYNEAFKCTTVQKRLLYISHIWPNETLKKANYKNIVLFY